ncbi:AlkZ-related protein [Paenibacillus marinisediminis]
MNQLIQTYDEAVDVVKKMGILPLTPLIPNYPSLEGVTPKEQWYTDSDQDPWRWRVRFAGDGHAAYGKFIKKKSVLISREVLPWVYALLSPSGTIEQRYANGLLSKEAKELYAIIADEPGIETRALRAAAGMKAKEKKGDFDKALQELQGHMDIVISGVKERRNAAGEMNGWRSTSYEPTQIWMQGAGVAIEPISRDEASSKLKEHLTRVSSEEATNVFAKIFAL